MREIMASTKVTGARRLASIAAAQRKVRDGQLYLLRRHGGFFRPDAHGYTMKLADAGLYTAERARQYLDVEGLSVVPLTSVRGRLEQEAEAAERDAAALRDKINIAGHMPA